MARRRQSDKRVALFGLILLGSQLIMTAALLSASRDEGIDTAAIVGLLTVIVLEIRKVALSIRSDDD